MLRVQMLLLLHLMVMALREGSLRTWTLVHPFFRTTCRAQGVSHLQGVVRGLQRVMTLKPRVQGPVTKGRRARLSLLLRWKGTRPKGDLESLTPMMEVCGVFCPQKVDWVDFVAYRSKSVPMSSHLQAVGKVRLKKSYGHCLLASNVIKQLFHKSGPGNWKFHLIRGQSSFYTARKRTLQIPYLVPLEGALSMAHLRAHRDSLDTWRLQLQRHQVAAEMPTCSCEDQRLWFIGGSVITAIHS